MCFVENLERKRKKQRQKGVFPTPNCQPFQIHGSKLKLDPSGDCGQASVVRVTHRIHAFRVFCFSDALHGIQIELPDVSRQELLSLLVCSAFRLVWAVSAILWRAAVTTLSILVGGGMPEFFSLRAEINILLGNIGVLPGTVAVLCSFVSGIWQNGNNPVSDGSFGDPGGLVAGIHYSIQNIVESLGDCGIQIIPCNAVMDIPGCYLNA